MPSQKAGLFYFHHTLFAFYHSKFSVRKNFPSHKSSTSFINHTIFTIFSTFLPVTQNAQRIVRIVDGELKPCEDVATQKQETKQNTDVEETEQLEQNTEKK